LLPANIDNLLFSGGWLDRLKLYCMPRAIIGEAYPCAVRTVRALQDAGLQPVFVSARQRLARRNTLYWLHEHGLDTAQLHLSPLTLPESARAAWKRSVIQRLRQEHALMPVAGVGDRPSDLQAYSDSGIRAIGVFQGTSSRAGVPSAQGSAEGPLAFKDGATNALQPHEQLAHVYSMLPATAASRAAVTLHVLAGSFGVGGAAFQPPFDTHVHATQSQLWEAVKADVLEAAEGAACDR